MLREAPEWAQQILERVGGKNPFGASLYRFVWGDSRREWVGGRWVDRDHNTGQIIREVIEQRFIPKYSHLEVDYQGRPAYHWYVERWYPAEHFGPRGKWESITLEREDGISVPARGPYPAHGDFDWAWTMEGPNGEFRQLTVARCEWIASILRDNELASAANRWAAKQAAKEQAEKQQDTLDREVLNDITPAFKGKMRRGTAVTVL